MQMPEPVELPKMLKKRAAVQLAYFVQDIADAARRHHALFGSGPFFIAEHIPLLTCQYRGQPASLDHSSAYGQWGAIMVEFVQQNNPGPSVFRDLYSDGAEGQHHVAYFSDDLDADLADFSKLGHVVGLDATLKGDVRFAMVDMVQPLGHFIELYAPHPSFGQFYEMVRKASDQWDGAEPLRALTGHRR
jgi:Glyoxalase/Bleomycin resistance protein/Dioxygenase superfamily